MANELDDAFLEQVRRETIPKLHAYTVVLGKRLEDHASKAKRIDRFKGSGVLVRLAGSRQFGILTAGHVVNALRDEATREDPARIVVALRGADVNRGVFPKLAPVTLTIPPRAIAAYGRKNEGCRGPDIAWIPLSPEQVIEIETGTESFGLFYNMGKSDREIEEVVGIWKTQELTQETKGERDSGQICYVVGWSETLQNPNDGEPLTLPAFEALLEHRWAEAGWQYDDYQIGAKNKARPRNEYKEGEMAVGFNYPDLLGGVSGAGVWRIAAHPTDARRLVHHLEGILFYDYRTEGRRYLRAHGSISIKRVLNAAGMYGKKRASDKAWTEMLDGYPCSNGKVEHS